MTIFNTHPNLDLPGINHGFFGRRGGVSKGQYESLNCGPGSHDDRAHVAENRNRVARAIALPGTHLCSLWQHHSADCLIIEKPLGDERPKADAMVTNRPGIGLGILTADCGPVLLADADAGIIGAAHAGWRGALGGVTDTAIRAMEALGASAENICAVIGPCITQPNYEVGPEFQGTFTDADPQNAAYFEPGEGDRFQFDLKAYIEARLRRAGVTQIGILPDCTYGQPETFFSHRHNVHSGAGDYGRNISVIFLQNS